MLSTRRVPGSKYLPWDCNMTSELLRECLFSLQGVSGERYIKFYDFGAGDVIVRTSPHVGKRDRDAAYLCGEAGCLYQKIQRKICDYEKRKNRIGNAFAAAVTRELHDEYLAFVTELQPRSLRSMVAEAAQPVRALKHLAIICETSLTGPDLLSWLHSLRVKGDDSHFQEIVRRIREATSRPWCESLRYWVVQGAIDDSDFFVDEVANVHPRDAWQCGHELDQTKVPDGIFLVDKVDLCNSVELSYSVGKGVHYIRKVLCDLKWQSPSFETISNTSLQESARQVHSKIKATLYSEHNLKDHLHALKQFLLLGQGDFCATLLDGLHSTEGAIFKLTLAALVDVALQGTVGLSEECCKRLQVSFQDHLGSDHPARYAIGPKSFSSEAGSVWDVLKLSYTVPDPLVAIVHTEAMKTYQRLFRTLWSIRQVEHQLSLMWQQSSVLQRALHINAHHLQVTVHTSANYAQAISVLRQVAMVRQSMMHFVVNLQSYLQMDVLSISWNLLLQRLDRAETLDDIIAAHDSYLKVMARKSFCNSDEREMGANIERLLKIANNFCAYQETVFREALEAVDRAAKRRRRQEWLIANERDWGLRTEKVEEEESCFGLSDPTVLDELSGLADIFHHQVQLLLAQIDDKLHGNSDVVLDEERDDLAVDSPRFGDLFIEKGGAQDDLDSLRSLAEQLNNSGFYTSTDDIEKL